MSILFRCTLLLSLFSLVRSDPFFSSLISKSVQNQYCTRFYHRSGGVGCRTPINGTLGILLPYSAFTNNTSVFGPEYAHPTVFLVNSKELSSELLQNLTRRSYTRGVLVVGSDMPTHPYSPVGVFPGGEGSPAVNISLHRDYPWNPLGSGIANEDLPFVIARVSDKQTIDMLKQRAAQNALHPDDHPYFVEMSDYMGPETMTSPRCLEQGHCVPIGGNSVWARAKNPAKRVTVVATALDATGEVYDGATDALGAGVTLAVTLSAAKALAEVATRFPDTELVVAFFQGEAWGRVGSRRFVDELRSFRCLNPVNASASPFNGAICASPLKLSLAFTELSLDAIEHVIVLDHLFSFSNELFLHAEDDVSLPAVDTLIPIQMSSITKLPPGIGESFFMAGVRNTQVLSGYDAHYESLYGTSFASLGEEAIQSVQDIADSVSSFIASVLVGESTNVTVSAEYLQDLLHCLAIDGKCAVIEQSLGLKENELTNSLHGQPIDKYAGTYFVNATLQRHSQEGRQPYLLINKKSKSVNYTGSPESISGVYFSPSLLESFVHTELSLSFHQNVTEQKCASWKDCKGMDNGYCIKGMCYASYAYFHDAFDTALIPMEPDVFKIDSNQTETPLFAEPYWGGYYGAEPFIRVYQVISPWTEWITLLAGVLITVVVWFVTKRFFKQYGEALKLD